MAVGSKYESTKNLTHAQLCARIRDEIKAAVAAKKLPKAKYGVSKHDYAGGWSINIKIAELPFPVANAAWHYLEFVNVANMRMLSSTELLDRMGFGPRDEPSLTREAFALRTTLQELVDEFGYDHSDLQTDYFNVRFYASLRFEAEAAERERILENAKIVREAYPDRWQAILTDATPEMRDADIARARKEDMPVAIPFEGAAGGDIVWDSPPCISFSKPASSRRAKRRERVEAATKAWETRRARALARSVGSEGRAEREQEEHEAVKRLLAETEAAMGIEPGSDESVFNPK
jgi:hypothetical protein